MSRQDNYHSMLAQQLSNNPKRLLMENGMNSLSLIVYRAVQGLL